MQRIAQCSCGSLKAIVDDSPTSVVACHCNACQRRTGSVFGVGAYFPEEKVNISGVASEFERTTDSGNSFVTFFCPTCGTSLYWRAGKLPGVIGIAVGAFADPSFPLPQRSVWEQSMHEWVHMSHIAQHFPKGRTT